jgi:ankyrin repeat protein
MSLPYSRTPPIPTYTIPKSTFILLELVRRYVPSSCLHKDNLPKELYQIIIDFSFNIEEETFFTQNMFSIISLWRDKHEKKTSKEIFEFSVNYNLRFMAQFLNERLKTDKTIIKRVNPKNLENLLKIARYTNIIKAALEEGINIDTDLDHGATTLTFACLYGNLEAVRFLLGKGANLTGVKRDQKNTSLFSSKNSIETTVPIFAAIRSENVEIVRLLIKAGVDINSRTFLYTPLEKASEICDPMMVKMMLENGGDVEAHGSFRVLLSAAENKNVEVAKLIFNNIENPHLDDVSVSQERVIIRACSHGNFETLKFLIENGFELRNRMMNNATGSLPLIYAFKGTSEFHIETFKSGDSRGPVHKGVIDPKLDLIEFLLKSGACVNSNVEGLSIVYLAVKSGRKEILEKVLEYEPKVNLNVHLCLNPLFCAIEVMKPELVEMLLIYGADPNIMVPEGEDTLLMKAVRNNFVPIVKHLLNYGANPNVPLVYEEEVKREGLKSGREGFGGKRLVLGSGMEIDFSEMECTKVKKAITPLRYAWEHNFDKVCSILIDYGAKDSLPLSKKITNKKF